MSWIGWRQDGVPLSLFLATGSAGAVAIDVALGAATAASLIGAWWVALRISVTARRLDATLAAHVGGLSGDRLIAVALLSGFAEELFFRGALQDAVGIWWATLIFALCHLGPVREARWWAGFAAVAGLLLGGLMLWRENLTAPVVAHCLVNAVGLHRLQRVAQSRAA